MISVITPTWNRHDLLFSRCIPSVAEQLIDVPYEHVIISDGPDPELRELLEGKSDVVYDELSVHSVESGAWGQAARIRGEQVAQYDIFAPLDDDDLFYPGHLQALYDALDGVDFAYSQMKMSYPGGNSSIVGTSPPTYGQVGESFMYRRSLAGLATWRVGQPSIDWDLVARWMAAGAKWSFVQKVTIECFPSVAWGTS